MNKELYKYISKQTNDPIIEWRQCSLSGKEFAVFESDLTFYQIMSPTFGDKKHDLPLPSLCPEERQRRRLLWRNERVIYKATSDLSGKSMMSIYHPDSPYTVYTAEEWFGDSWNGTDFARIFDTGRSFFEQFHELSIAIPHIATYSTNAVSSSFSHATNDIKNCYLCFHLASSKDCMYCYVCTRITQCMDCHLTYDSELCYQCINVHRSYQLFYGDNCHDCRESWFLESCHNCHHCFGCIGLNNASYQIFNEQYSKEEYAVAIKRLLATSSVESLKERHKDICDQYPHLYSFVDHSENAFGCYLDHCSEVVGAYACTHVEQCKYVLNVDHATRCMDYDIYGDHSELIYECIMTGTQTSRNAFCIGTWVGSHDNWYSLFLFNSHHCFGCVGLKNSSYCIFNKQYDKADWEEEVVRITEEMKKQGEWGEFFPHYISPFAYNETMAQDFYPLSKESSVEKGYRWLNHNYTVDVPEEMKTRSTADLPGIGDVDDEILKEAFLCEESVSPFRLVKKELEFYRRFGLPLPRVHPHVRQEKRLAQRAGHALFLRECDKSDEEIVSVYPESVEFDVYGESAYRDAMFG